ncbi:MAG: hypothetical protein FJ271_07145 [Planctomycetes bacterium]|nr:hypothetical protein [Planctomycetota bacterium]
MRRQGWLVLCLAFSWTSVTPVAVPSVSATGPDDSTSLAQAAKNVRQIIAHRGSSSDRPENTLASYRRAIEVGAGVIECDVRTTRDGILVSLHDADVSRTSNGKGLVRDMTLAALRRLDFGSWFDARFQNERIPTLHEILTLCRGKIDVMLDLKESGQAYAENVADLVRKHGEPKRIILGVRSVGQARHFRKLLPVSRQMGLIAATGDISAFADAGVDMIRLWPNWLSDRSLIAQVRNHKKHLHLSAPKGTKEQVLPLLIHEPESLSSDDPARLAQTLRAIAVQQASNKVHRPPSPAAQGVHAKQARIARGRRQLFVDDHIISEKSGVTRELGRVTKANDGKPIFTDGWFYGTVLRDQDKFQLWYRKPGDQGYGYAESTDGLKFLKKADVKGIPFAGDYNLAVEIDTRHSGKKRRYLGSFDARGMAAGLAYSADGITWIPSNGGKAITYRAADSYNQVLWDGEAKVYRLFTRTDLGTGGGPLAGSVAKDFEVRGTRSMTNPDINMNPAGWKLVRHWHFNREGPKEYLRRQLTCWIHEGVYFALMSVYEYPGDVSEGKKTDHRTRHERDVMNFYMATSRDGDSWDLHWVYAGKPLVPRGPAGSFDMDMVFPSSTVVTHQDEHWLYYAGANERHGTYETKPPVLFERQEAIGLAKLRLDRFVCLDATDKPGSVTTRPFVLEGKQLQLNVEAPRGEVTVEVLDQQGQPIRGFSKGDARKAAGIDELRWQPRWTGHTDLSSLRETTIRLRITLRNARLYALQIQ